MTTTGASMLGLVVVVVIIAGVIALEGIHGLLLVIVVGVIAVSIAVLAFGLSNHGHG
jgi:hypothetical protein